MTTTTNGEAKTTSQNLTLGGANILKTILNTPGWYEGKARLLLDAGVLLDGVLSEVAPPAGGGTALELWADRPQLVVTTVPQREACRTCISHYLGKSAFDNTKHVRALVREFEIE